MNPTVSHIFVAPEFKSCGPVKGQHHPGAQGENRLPGSRGVCTGQPWEGSRLLEDRTVHREGESLKGLRPVWLLLRSECLGGLLTFSSVESGFSEKLQGVTTVKPVPALKAHIIPGGAVCHEPSGGGDSGAGLWRDRHFVGGALCSPQLRRWPRSAHEFLV